MPLWAFQMMAGLPPGCIGAKSIDRPRLIKPMPYFFDQLDGPIRGRIEAVLRKLTGAAATVEERRIEQVQYTPAVQFVTIAADGCQSNWVLLTGRGDRIGAEVRVRLDVASSSRPSTTSRRMSLQLVGRPGADATVLAVGKWAETVLAE